jgi:methionyl-tRNA synthetase
MRSKGDRVLFVSGSDEHGTPLELQAIKEGVRPEELTDRMHAVVKDLFARFEIAFDNYTRTHSKTHIEFVQRFFLELYRKGYVFKRSVEQLYCEADRIFLPDRFVIGTCPHCGYDRARGDQCERCGRVLDPLDLIGPRCAICGAEPVVRSTDHWFFDLPAFEDRIKAWIASNDRFPDSVRNFSLGWIGEGLRPRSITRDNRWGIPAPFPGAEGKTIYVWFEAVLGYLTASIEWAEMRGEPEAWKEFWYDREARSVYFIGKDNIPFHTIILPALLMAYDEDLVLPWNVLATEYLTFEGKKFSKSAGVGIWLDEALEILGPDYWRFYLVKIRPETADSNFTASHFRDVINDELNDIVGNFVHRVLTFLYRSFDGTVPDPGALDAQDRELLASIRKAAEEFESGLVSNRFRSSVNSVLDLAKKGNVYLNAREPWKAIKTDKGSAMRTIYASTQVAYGISVLLEPLTPRASEALRRIFRLPPERWTVKELVEGRFIDPGHLIDEPSPPFSRLSDEVYERIKSKGGSPA